MLQRAELLLQRLSCCVSGALAPQIPDLAAAIAAAKDGETDAAEKRGAEEEKPSQDSLGMRCAKAQSHTHCRIGIVP